MVAFRRLRRRRPRSADSVRNTDGLSRSAACDSPASAARWAKYPEPWASHVEHMHSHEWRSVTLGSGIAALLVGTAVGAVQQAAQVRKRGRGRFYVLDGVNPLSRGQRPGSGHHHPQLSDARLEVIENDGQIRRVMSREGTSPVGDVQLVVGRNRLPKSVGWRLYSLEYQVYFPPQDQTAYQCVLRIEPPAASRPFPASIDTPLHPADASSPAAPGLRAASPGQSRPVTGVHHELCTHHRRAAHRAAGQRPRISGQPGLRSDTRGQAVHAGCRRDVAADRD